MRVWHRHYCQQDPITGVFELVREHHTNDLLYPIFWKEILNTSFWKPTITGAVFKLNNPTTPMTKKEVTEMKEIAIAAILGDGFTLVHDSTNKSVSIDHYGKCDWLVTDANDNSKGYKTLSLALAAASK